MKWNLGRKRLKLQAHGPREGLLAEAKRFDSAYERGLWTGSVQIGFGSAGRRYVATLWYTDREGPGSYSVEIVQRRDGLQNRVVLRKDGLFPLQKALDLVDREVERSANASEVELRLRKQREAAQQRSRAVEQRLRRR
ncbi:hypothetical protein [Motilibacter aurantiacus]|uniref:hypothetical protein n=1 Tax=Motilibacter aurantiacus TaxID=2714955 RepID=UPI001409D734|nr:hypothetical protein [Motilibacter aurantiacus]NHC45688.1 hypothetical protein [Motilibacter aurantiacus]